MDALPSVPPAPTPEPVKVAKAAKAAKAPPAEKAATSKVTSDAPGGKTAQLVAMITKGASASELQKALGWLPHTCRGAISRLHSDWGYSIERTKVGGESHYKIAS